ncbi:MAG: hypothetical protein KGJ07_10050 [Patescibacteria group bacterium]|nr:hypothetical protein [Patescibacteria group bacterium]
MQAEGLPEKKNGSPEHYSNHYQGRKKALSEGENSQAAAKVRQPAILNMAKNNAVAKKTF